MLLQARLVKVRQRKMKKAKLDGTDGEEQAKEEEDERRLLSTCSDFSHHTVS